LAAILYPNVASKEDNKVIVTTFISH